jgi:hypothetical protein
MQDLPTGRIIEKYTEHTAPDPAREVHSLTTEEYVTSQVRGLSAQVAVTMAIQFVTLLLTLFIVIFMMMDEAHGAMVVEGLPIRIDTPCVIYAQIPKPPPMLVGSATVYTQADRLIDCGEYWLAVEHVEERSP